MESSSESTFNTYHVIHFFFQFVLVWNSNIRFHFFFVVRSNKVVKWNHTRWNSLYHHLFRFLVYEDAINFIVSHLNRERKSNPISIITTDEWDLIHSLVQILQPVNEISTIVQAKEANISCALFYQSFPWRLGNKNESLFFFYQSILTCFFIKLY